MGKSSKITVGYWYHPAFHMGLNMGPIDALLEVRGGDLTAWSGELTASGTITINASNLWGGEKDQGGIAGDADVMFGEPTQQPNQYLIDTFGPQQSAWRGFATFVWKGGRYGAMNPYPQKISFKGRKIKMGWDGDPGDGSACWYPEKAEVQVAASSSLPGDADGWDYQILPAEANPGYDNLAIPTDGWIVDGQAPFGNGAFSYNTNWPEKTTLWLKRTVSITGSGQRLIISAENGCLVFINGALSGAINRDNINLGGTPPPYVFPVQAGQSIDIAIKAFDETDPNAHNTLLTVEIVADGLTAMNPAHVLYYARTQQHMGREPAVNIDDASHRVAADWFYAQGFGICPDFDASQESAAAYIARIEKVSGCAQSRNPVDGKWYLFVANGEYDLDSLPILTDDDILEYNKQPTILDNAVNSVSVKYRDPQLKTSPTTPPVEALALTTQFGTIHQDVTYNEIPTSGLALRVATRELLNTTTPTNGFDLTTNRKSYAWMRGSYFRLQAPKRGIADMVCIVGGNDSGTLPSGAIKLTAAQDIYSLPATAFVQQEPGVDTRPSPIPLGIMTQAAFEAPYIEVVRDLSRADLAALPDDAGFLLTVAQDPSTSRDYNIMISTDGGATYAGSATGIWCPSALIVEGDALTDAAPATGFTLAGGVLLSSVAVGSAAIWEGEDADGNPALEWCRVDALDAGAGALTLGRGCADTVPLVHAENARIWFYDGFAGADVTEYTDGEMIDVKLLTNTGSAQLDPSLATAIPLTFDQRQFRPYPPAGVMLNGASFPSALSGPISVAFVPRNRVTQADQLVDWSSPGVAAEANTTWTLRGYIGGNLDAEFDGQAGSPIAWTPGSSGTAKVELVSVRDGVESTPFVHAFVYGTAAWTPANLASPPIAWFNDSSTLTGTTTCSQWNDISGKNNHLVQSIAGNQPQIVANGLNARRVMSFATSYLNTGSGTAISRNTGAFWAIVVYRKRTVDASATGRRMLNCCVGGAGQSTRLAIEVGNTAAANGIRLDARRLDGDSTALLAGPSSNPPNWHMLLGVVDYSTGTGQIYMDGASVAQASNWVSEGLTSDTAAYAGLTIGAYNSSNAIQEFADIDVAEIVVGQDSVPASGDIDKIFGYAAWRWGLQALLPAGHPYKTSAPTV